ncbi:unnamed protein product [Trichobilharzia regenti]|nr:unnamed protein product [Trichobilharzia regenti]
MIMSKVAVDFYLRIPAFRPNLSQQSDTSNLGDIEGNFESIESMSQMNRTPNLPNDLAYSGNTESGNTHTASSSAVAVAAASLVAEERSADQQEMFFSLLLESQSRRMDEQRCYLRTSQGTPPVQSTEAATNITPEELDHSQSSENPHQTPDTSNSPIQSQIGANDEAFFDLIEGVQLGDSTGYMTAHMMIGEISSLMMSTQTETTATDDDDDQTDSSQFLLSNNLKIRTATTETNTTSVSSFLSSPPSTSVQPLNSVLNINNSRLLNHINDDDNNTTTNIVLSNHNSSCVNSVVNSSSTTANTPIVDGDNCTVVNGLKLPSTPTNSSTLSSALLDNWINTDRVNRLSGGKASHPTDTSTTPAATLNTTTPVAQYTDQATQTVANDHDIFHDHEDSVDLELDKDLERELLENYEGILETVEFVTVTEDGETVTSRMGCLGKFNKVESLFLTQ